MIQLLSPVSSAVLLPGKLQSGMTDMMSGTTSPSGSTSDEFDFRIDDDDDSDETDDVHVETDERSDMKKFAALSLLKETAALIDAEEVDGGQARLSQEDTSIVKELLPLVDIPPSLESDVGSHSQSLPEEKAVTQENRSAPLSWTSCLVHSPECSRRKRMLRLQQKLRSTMVDDLSSSMRTADSTIATSESNVPALEVQFSTVTIRDFPRTIGDNPASSAGLSVSIDWNYEKECTLSLDEYEDRRKPRRLGREMIMPPQVREVILREAGFSRAEIVRALRELNVVRGQRRRTYETLHLQPLQALSEKITRKAWNLVTLGEYKRKERSLINPYRNKTKTLEDVVVDSACKQETCPMVSPDELAL